MGLFFNFYISAVFFVAAIEKLVSFREFSYRLPYLKSDELRIVASASVILVEMALILITIFQKNISSFAQFILCLSMLIFHLFRRGGKSCGCLGPIDRSGSKIYETLRISVLLALTIVGFLIRSEQSTFPFALLAGTSSGIASLAIYNIFIVKFSMKRTNDIPVH